MSYVVFPTKTGKDLETILNQIHDHMLLNTRAPVDLSLLKEIMDKVKKENDHIERERKNTSQFFWLSRKASYITKISEATAIVIAGVSIAVQITDLFQNSNEGVDCIQSVIPYGVPVDLASDACRADPTLSIISCVASCLIPVTQWIDNRIAKKREEAEAQNREIVDKLEDKQQFSRFATFIEQIIDYMRKKDGESLKVCINTLELNKDDLYMKRLGTKELTASYLLHQSEDPEIKRILDNIKAYTKDQPPPTPPAAAPTSRRHKRRRREGASSSQIDERSPLEKEWKTLEKRVDTTFNHLRFDNEFITSDGRCCLTEKEALEQRTRRNSEQFDSEGNFARRSVDDNQPVLDLNTDIESGLKGDPQPSLLAHSLGDE